MPSAGVMRTPFDLDEVKQLKVACLIPPTNAATDTYEHADSELHTLHLLIPALQQGSDDERDCATIMHYGIMSSGRL